MLWSTIWTFFTSESGVVTRRAGLSLGWLAILLVAVTLLTGATAGPVSAADYTCCPIGCYGYYSSCGSVQSSYACPGWTYEYRNCIGPDGETIYEWQYRGPDGERVCYDPC